MSNSLGSSSTSQAQRFFRTPELLDIVTSMLSRRDRIRVLSVSHTLFDSAAPTIWRRLWRTSDLLLLISHSRLVKVSESTELVEFPCPLTKNHLKRLNVYGRFVRELTIGDEEQQRSPYPFHSRNSSIRSDSVLNWEALAGCFSDCPLLPNLVEIALWNPDHHVCLKWLQVLLYPSVRRVSMGSRWPVEAACEFLGLVGRRSVPLEYLSVVVDDSEADHAVAGPVHNTSWQNQSKMGLSLDSLRHIRSLDLGAASLCPGGLVTLSRHPYLQELSVSAERTPRTDNILFGPAPFPSMRKIFLNNVPCGFWLIGFCSLAPLFKNLEAVYIAIQPDWMLKPGFDSRSGDSFLQRLCETSPKITNLVVLFAGKDDNAPVITISQAGEAALRKLQLESLVLDSARLEGGCEFLSSAWPGIVRLRCNRQQASIEHLACFARNLPRLQRLVLDLDWTGSSIPSYDPGSPISPQNPAFTALCMVPLRRVDRFASVSKRLAECVPLLIQIVDKPDWIQTDICIFCGQTYIVHGHGGTTFIGAPKLTATR
ncbi:F-box protein [Ceratobasidium sp. AG-Ba]|nr:F-box protein [Ceratobasidium sp. AG-Ba]